MEIWLGLDSDEDGNGFMSVMIDDHIWTRQAIDQVEISQHMTIYNRANDVMRSEGGRMTSI